MEADPQNVRVWFWLWVTTAFVLGLMVGFAGCILLLMILQAMIGYV